MTCRTILTIAAGLAATCAFTRKLILAATVAVPLTFTAPAQDGEFDHSHAAFTAILRANVANERFNYAAIKKNPAPLAAYLGALGAVGEKEFNGWSKDQRLAFLINLYNAATVKLVVENYPVKSIKKIGNLIKGPWDQVVVSLFGRTVTLKYIEHELIRPRYAEPRVHFALVCAAVGCPPLRAEAYVHDRLGIQLDEQGRLFFAAAGKNRLDAVAGILYLSPIFDWFEQDFTDQAGSVEAFVAPYFPESARPLILSGKLKVKFTDYDWSLNKQ